MIESDDEEVEEHKRDPMEIPSDDSCQVNLEPSSSFIDEQKIEQNDNNMEDEQQTSLSLPFGFELSFYDFFDDIEIIRKYIALGHDSWSKLSSLYRKNSFNHLLSQIFSSQSDFLHTIFCLESSLALTFLNLCSYTCFYCPWMVKQSEIISKAMDENMVRQSVNKSISLIKIYVFVVIVCISSWYCISHTN